MQNSLLPRLAGLFLVDNYVLDNDSVSFSQIIKKYTFQKTICVDINQKIVYNDRILQIQLLGGKNEKIARFNARYSYGIFDGCV